MNNIIKKIILVIVFMPWLLIGCSLAEYSDFKEKPSDFYYTETLNNIVKEDDISIRILETNFYKEVILKKENLNLITDFIKEINNVDLIQEFLSEEELPEKSLYKIYIDSDNKDKKFVIEIYGDDLIAIFPWDGYYKKDILKLKDLPTSLKPEALCKYILSL